MQDLTRNEVVTYDFLWAMFPPGLDVDSKDGSRHRMYEMQSTYYLQESLTFRHCTLTRMEKIWILFHDVEHRQVQRCHKLLELKVFPAHLHPEANHLFGLLEERGKKFEQLNVCHHVSYSSYFEERVEKSSKRSFISNDLCGYQGQPYADAHLNGRKTSCSRRQSLRPI